MAAEVLVTSIEALASSPGILLWCLLIFGIAPGVVTRLFALAYPKDDPRRREMIAEVYAIPPWRRPMWTAQQLELATCEGLQARWAHHVKMRQRRAQARADRERLEMERREAQIELDRWLDEIDLRDLLSDPPVRSTQPVPTGTRWSALAPAVLLVTMAGALSALAVLPPGEPSDVSVLRVVLAAVPPRPWVLALTAIAACSGTAMIAVVRRLAERDLPHAR